MLLTIATRRETATDLSYLPHKQSDRFQTFALSFGKAHVFYPQAEENYCVAERSATVDGKAL